MKYVTVWFFRIIGAFLQHIGAFTIRSLSSRGGPIARTVVLCLVILGALGLGIRTSQAYDYLDQAGYLQLAKEFLIEHNLLDNQVINNQANRLSNQILVSTGIPGFTVSIDALKQANLAKWNECVQTGRGPAVRKALIKGGFRQPQLDEALVVTCAESTWNHQVVGSEASVGVDIGLCQINTYYQRNVIKLFGFTENDLKNAERNALVCKYIHDTQGGWKPWYPSRKNHGLGV
jgi:hypothetical protein